MSGKLSHIDAEGNARMVDVSAKDDTVREAHACGFITMQPETLALVVAGGHKKGDVLGVARIAGIQAAKKCADLIPLCHPLMLTGIDVELTPETELSRIRVDARCKLTGKTGVEMEALTAASVALLTVYDMCKAVDKAMVLEGVRLLEKQGGRSGHFQAADQD